VYRLHSPASAVKLSYRVPWPCRRPEASINHSSQYGDYVIAGLHPQSPRYVARQLSARVSQALRPSYLSHVISADT
jgi:hypothetical protein